MRDRPKINRTAVLRTVILLGLSLALLVPYIFMPASGAAAVSTPSSVQLNVNMSPLEYGGYDTTEFKGSINGHSVEAYCAEPDMPTPSSGSYAARPLYREDGGSLDVLAKMIWYGYGGPGFDARMWPSQYYDGTSLRTNGTAQYCITHILISANYAGKLYEAVYGTYENYRSWVYSCISYWDENSNSPNQNQNLEMNFVNEVYWDGTPVPAEKRMPSDFKDYCYLLKTGGASQTIAGYFPGGSIEISKTSSDPGITDSNGMYSSFSGTSYGIYEDAACSRLVDTVVLDGSGAGLSDFMLFGTYYVKEVSAPSGYSLSSSVYPASIVNGGKSRIDVKDDAVTDSGMVVISKYDAEAGWNPDRKPQGNASFADAEYTVEYYDGIYSTASQAQSSGSPKRKWVFRTDAEGSIDLGNASQTLVSGTLYRDGNGRIVFPLGSYTVYETKAPEGYLISNERHLIVVKQSGNAAQLDGDLFAHELQKYIRSAEKIVRGGVSVVKRDRETADGSAQGDGTLAGTVIAIVNRGRNAVIVDGASHGTGEVVSTITTDESGFASTGPDALPYGHYSLYETDPSDGYLLTDADPREFDITEDGVVVKIPEGKELYNHVIRGGVEIQKRDIESGLPGPLGGASLAGTEFEIANKSERSVRVEGNDYSPGDIVKTIITGEDGKASTSGDCLPYGTYSIRETAPSAGYHLTDGKERTFTIREEGKIESITERPDDWANQVYRGDIEFNKVSEKDMSRLAGVPFNLISETTGETHVIVTDENGYASTASSWNRHSSNTNGNDEASEGYYDDMAGIWFGSAEGGWIVDVDDSLGALPYDRYTLEELPCAANDGLELVRIEHITVKRDAVAVNLGTIDDRTPEATEPYIHTTASDGKTGLPYAVGDVDALINDHVEYMDLDPEKTYTLKAELRYADDESLVEGSQTETVFKPEASNGYVNVSISVNLLLAEGRSVVVFERLYEGDELVAAHADIEDKEQTVQVKAPSIGTIATDADDGDHAVLNSPDARITDVIEYRNLAVGETYLAKGTLMVKVYDEDGNVTAEPLRDGEGSEITSTIEFIPETPDGTVEVVFEFDASDIDVGAEIVVYELVAKGDVVIASHEDPEDEGQTVVVGKPEVRTVAENAFTGTSHVHPAKSAVIRDTVSYEGLTPGKEYEMRARIVVIPAYPEDIPSHIPIAHRLSGMPDEYKGAYILCDESGLPIEASESFTPQDSYGAVEITLPVDASNLDGARLVIFEKLFRHGKELASHEDVTDEGQTVGVEKPRIGTSAENAATGTGHVHPSGGASLKDAVTYTDLIPDKTYEMRARIVIIPADAEDIPEHIPAEFRLADVPAGYEGAYIYCDSDGNPVEVSQEFMPLDSYGTVEIVFPIDASGLLGARLVAFEKLFDNGDEIANHEDVTDEGQSVDVVSPEISTLASNPETHIDEICAVKTGLISDRVSYTGLNPGTEYEMRGRIAVVPSEPEAVPDSVPDEYRLTGIPEGYEGAYIHCDSDGSPIESIMTFTPVDTYGVVDVEFPIDTSALLGSKLVFFEELYEGGDKLVEHADITNEAQTISVIDLSIGTRASGKITGENWAYSSEGTVIADRVGYTGLVPGKTYTMVGNLAVVPTDPGDIPSYVPEACRLSDLPEGFEGAYIYCDEHGNPVTVTQDFIPDDSYGYLDMMLPIDASGLLGAKVVVFEQLLEDGDRIAKHDDITDDDQSVDIVEPSIQTEATDSTDGDHVFLPSSETRINDRISYENLVPGTEYTMKGWLVDKKTGRPLAVKDKPIEGTATFMPNSSSGEVNVLFAFDASKFTDGSEYVAFEELYLDSVLAAEHKDIQDASQTVAVSSTPTGSGYAKTGGAWTFFAALLALGGIGILCLKARNRRIGAGYED